MSSRKEDGDLDGWRGLTVYQGMARATGRGWVSAAAPPPPRVICGASSHSHSPRAHSQGKGHAQGHPRHLLPHSSDKPGEFSTKMASMRGSAACSSLLLRQSARPSPVWVVVGTSQGASMLARV
ncbi:hypothetical protein E2C01_079773 [Portunus trituberculatus]|uniref:Uncharacterized protein n=1 Tax=Portunus trituberculatus TaxID=210409 RepID=A0A5B7IRE5_PORTR|nr:hypothetical protein [Portunus trituberculatus]